MPDFGIAGSQMMKRCPFDSDVFYSATVRLLETTILAPFSVLEKVKVMVCERLSDKQVGWITEGLN